MNTTIPELSDEQIESMRFTIMTDVGKASQIKTRRYRRIVVGAAFVVALGGIGGIALGSYNGSPTSTPSAPRADSGARSSGDSKAASPQVSASNGVTTDESAPAREVVTTGSVSMTVGKPVATASRIIGYVEAAGGHVDSRDETDASGHGNVTLVVRVPQSKVSATIDRLRSYGTVDSVSLADQDVTTQGQDLDARIKALRISVARLMSIMKDSKSTSELLQAETALSQRQANLDSLVAQRRGLTNQVKFSSLQFDISARPGANSVTPSGFRGGIIDGWNGLVSTVDGAVHGLGIILPWGGALVLLGAISWAIRRATHKAA